MACSTYLNVVIHIDGSISLLSRISATIFFIVSWKGGNKMIDELTKDSYSVIYVDLKKIMKQKNISVNALSKMTGIRYHIVKKYYLNQVYRVDLENLKKYCIALDCRPEDIIKIK